MNKAILALSLLFVLVTGFSCSNQDVTEEQSSVYTLSEQGRIELDNVNGQVRILASNGHEVDLQAIKKANNSEALKALEIDIDATHDFLKIHTRQPSRKNFWNLFAGGGSSRVDYLLKVPAYIRLESISTVNGSVNIENMAADIKASTVNGSLHVTSARGKVRLTTVNGSINASVDPQEGKPISMNTVNGSLSLTLPPNVSADLSANTVNGKIRCEFDLSREAKEVVSRRLEARIGSGEIPIKLETVNGRISIFKGHLALPENPVEKQ